jgi:glycine/D-amino acid oxidase-like deaminating enzyme/nitrite reductase/ring-hydroxylating ferredoxin subunit
VVGAGIAGLSIAYEFARAGRSVVVLDRGPIGGGMTARTTAHLASALDDYYHDLIGLRGLDEARQVYQAQASAIDRIEQISREEGIDCDFRRLDGYLFLGPGCDPSLLDREFEAARQVGFAAVDFAERAPIPGRDTGRCLRFPDQGRFHPLKYLDGLARSIRRDGGRLHAGTVVVGVEEDGEEVVVRTEGGPIVRAGACAVATNSPINDKVAIHTKQAPCRTYVIAGRVPRGSVPDALYWDTLDPYHYVRLQPADEQQDWLIAGGEDHKSGEASDMDERLARLEAWTREHFPPMGAVEHRWSGMVMEPVDRAAFIGRNHGNRNVYIATGDSGQGMTNGVAAGLIISNLVLGRESPFAAAHAPTRVTLSAAGEFLRENLSMVVNMTEHVRGGEVASVEDLKPGAGAIVRQGLGKVAAYRDESGILHLRSAVCTHMGCVVHWNPFERCWDCPCHGSQFGIDGTALNGPAVKPLAKVGQGR